MKFSRMVLVASAIAAAALAQHNEVQHHKDAEALRGAQHFDLHNAEEGAHRHDSVLDDKGKDKSTVETVASLTATMTAGDQHSDEYSHIHDNALETETAAERDNLHGRRAMHGHRNGANTHSDRRGDQHLRNDMPHHLGQNDFNDMEDDYSPHGRHHEDVLEEQYMDRMVHDPHHSHEQMWDDEHHGADMDPHYHNDEDIMYNEEGLNLNHGGMMFHDHDDHAHGHHDEVRHHGGHHGMVGGHDDHVIGHGHGVHDLGHDSHVDGRHAHMLNDGDWAERQHHVGRDDRFDHHDDGEMLPWIAGGDF